MTPFLAQPVWGRKEKEREKREEGVRERDSTLSLDFSAIGPSNPDEARGKVDPTARATHRYRDCGVSTTPGGRGFLLLGYSCLKCHEKNGFGSCETENNHVFQSQRNGTECLMRGLS